MREIREVREVRNDFVPMPVPAPPPMMSEPAPRVVREVVEERRERGVSRGSRRRGSVSSGDLDEVVVIEDHSPPRRARRSRSRRGSGGYRPVDPGAWGGGDASVRHVRR